LRSTHIICTPQFVKYALHQNTDQIKQDEMDGVCSAHGEISDEYKILVGKPERRKPLGRTKIMSENNVESSEAVSG
jgi:hypothetical protein